MNAARVTRFDTAAHDEPRTRHPRPALAHAFALAAATTDNTVSP